MTLQSGQKARLKEVPYIICNVKSKTLINSIIRHPHLHNDHEGLRGACKGAEISHHILTLALSGAVKEAVILQKYTTTADPADEI
jgi:hypothetical protein